MNKSIVYVEQISRGVKFETIVVEAPQLNEKLQEM